MEAKQLLYDGSFDGFLTCVFYAYELKYKEVTIQYEQHAQAIFFSEPEIIITDAGKANRVWKGIKSKATAKACNQLFYAFLSEQENVENLLFSYIKNIFKNEISVVYDYANPVVLKVAQIAKMVGREKHRMEAFVRFQLTKDNIYFANISPDFNVLPLIMKHFERRYADQKWIIYDLKRNYGIYYDLKSTEIVTLNLSENLKLVDTNTNYFAEEESKFQKLWKDYFESTNIKERKNLKLHTRHVPKRYWKYLSEKQPT